MEYKEYEEIIRGEYENTQMETLISKLKSENLELTKEIDRLNRNNKLLEAMLKWWNKNAEKYGINIP